jgi:hypothetical protein
MSWEAPIVRLLVTEDCCAKAIVRYQLTQLECQIRRGNSFCNFSDPKVAYVKPGEVFVHQPISLVYDKIDDTSLFAWIEKMFEAFAGSCPMVLLNTTKSIAVAQLRSTSSIKINELFKLISEAQRAPTSYDKNG